MTLQEKYVWNHLQTWYALPGKEQQRVVKLLRKFQDSIDERDAHSPLLPMKAVPDVLRVTADHLNVKVDELKLKSRKMRMVYARQLICYILKRYCEMSLREILEELQPPYGQPAITDHTTVIHGIKTISGMIDVDDGNVRNDIAKIIDMVQTAP